MASRMLSARAAEDAVVAVLTEQLTSQPENPVQQSRFLPLARQIVDRLAALPAPDEGQVERVARALFGLDTTHASTWENHSEMFREVYRERARAAIAASSPPSSPEGHPNWMRWFEAWLSGYNGRRDGVLDDESLFRAAREAFERSGPETAKRVAAMLDAQEGQW